MRAERRLLSWLGPWADPTRRPADVRRTETSIVSPGRGDLRAWVYEPESGPTVGAFLVAHGLNPMGPADPRFDRIMRIIANAGLVVMCPFLPDYLAVRLDPAVADDFAAALGALRDRDDLPCPPGLLSISFGSFPALCVACAPDTAEQISGTITFGGYGDLEQTLRFTLQGSDGRTPDPLSMPALALNLCDRVEGGESDAVQQGWRDFINGTWGRPEMKDPNQHGPVARELGGRMSESDRLLFMRGCGLSEDARGFWLDALGGEPLSSALDPRPYLVGLRRPLHLMHGVDDDVIPASQVEVLQDAIPPNRTVTRHLTGLYDHTRSSEGASAVGAVPMLFGEGLTLLRMVQALVRSGG